MQGGVSSSWHPSDFASEVHAALGQALAEFKFRRVKRRWADTYEIFYRNSHVRLRFWWDRQEMDGMLWPHRRSVRGKDTDMAFALTKIFDFLGLTEPGEAFFLQLRTPDRFHSHLNRCAEYLPKCRDFLLGAAGAYAALRRYLEIRHLAYTWEIRDAYQESEKVTAQVLKTIRQYALQWWREGDYRSVVAVLEIIEAQLTEEERELLSRARSKVKSGD